MTRALDDLGWGPFFADQVTDDDAGLVPMRIAAVHRSRLMAETGAGQVRLDLPLHATTADFAVGDWVLAKGDTRVVARLLDRRALLRRRTEGADARQLIAANVDTLFVVTSCNDDFNPARLERYLALANEAGTDPVIVLTKIDKIDKVDDPSDWVDRARTLQRGLQVVALNAKSPDAAAVLAPWCGPGRTVALVGSSGVGKSTLLNTLSGRDAQATGEIRESDAKGRHTTTARSLHPVAGGGWVIDTPGMRTLHVADVAMGIEMLFAEITELAPHCRFRDCTHAHEPGCAVQAAVRAGTLDADRLERWRKLHDENRDNTPVQTGPRGNRTTLPRGGRRR